MNFLAWILSLSMLAGLTNESVNFYKASVCRQKAWLKSTELQTRTLLSKFSETEMSVDPGCKVYAVRKSKKVTWQRLPSYKKHAFILPLKGRI